LATILINCYRSPATLYISGDVFYSQEGTTQDDPLTMPMYALATLPLIGRLPSDVSQVWYADDACAGGNVTQLRLWWKLICEMRPQFGYNANAVKTWFFVKPAHLESAKRLFTGTGVNISVEGRPYLGASIGTQEFTNNYVDEKVREWSSEISTVG